MAHKNILFHSAAREKLLRGTTALAAAVRVTLGPKSKSVLIQKKFGLPIVCNDGVTIAKEISLKDPEEDLGIGPPVKQRIPKNQVLQDLEFAGFTDIKNHFVFALSIMICLNQPTLSFKGDTIIEQAPVDDL